MILGHFLLILLASLVFFAVIPGIGAVLVREKWRRFRNAMFSSTDHPLYKPGIALRSEGDQGRFRCFGTLESIQDNDRIWLQVDGQSVSVDMTNQVFFVLPGRDEEYSLDGTLSVQSQRWERSGILTEGIGVFVFGEMRLQDGMPHFAAAAHEPLLIVLYEGAPERILSRSLWYGRQRNEYWNDFTPVSLLAGTSALMALAFFFFSNPDMQNAAIYASAFALVPFLPLMPPGVIAFFLYRRWWRKGRVLRERKDLMALGTRILESDFVAVSSSYESKVVAKDEWERRSDPIAESGRDRRAQRTAAVYENTDCLVIPEQGVFDFPFRQRTAKGKRDAIRFFAKVPGDPMAECIVVEGDPVSRTNRDLRRARRYEIGAAIAMAIATLVNWYLVLWLVFAVLRSVTVLR